MYTHEGRYFTGYKTYWHASPEPSGHVSDIEVAVKAFDNEGRSFETKPTKLSAEQTKRALLSTQDHQAVVDELIRDAYEKGCAAELVAKLLSQVKDGQGQASQARQDQGHVSDAAVPGSGNVLEKR